MSDRLADGRPALGNYSAGHKAHQLPPPHQHPDQLPTFGAAPSSSTDKSPISLPPPPPSRMHSYHHPLSATSQRSHLGPADRGRQPPPPPPLWNQDETEASSRSSSSNELPRFLGHRAHSSSTSSFQLPPLSSSLGPTSAWRMGTNRDDLRRPPLSPSGRGQTIDAIRENSSLMSGSRTGDRRLPPFSPPLGAGPSSAVDLPADPDPATGQEILVPGTRKMAKAHVPSACLNCKRAHLACDVGRPCRRCINLGKSDTCIDVQHKKRGRPRLKDRQDSQTSIGRSVHLGESKRTSTSPSSTAVMRYSPQSEPGYFQSPTRASDNLSPPLLAATSTHRIPGPTHGTHLPTRTPSASVSGSSYPFSRPDNARTFSDSQYSSHTGAGSGPSSFSQTASAVVTIICSTNLQCARVSEDCLALLGYQPSEVLERSLFELVHPSESSRLEELWTSLIDPVGVVPQAVPASADVVMSTPPARLMAPAAGTIFVQENMRLRQRSGMYDFYSIRLHLGGGFGVDLYRRETLDRAYIVASLLKLGNDATHPDASVLRNPYQGGRTASGNVFWTPLNQMPMPLPGLTGERPPDGYLRGGSGIPAYPGPVEHWHEDASPRPPAHHRSNLASYSQWSPAMDGGGANQSELRATRPTARDAPSTVATHRRQSDHPAWSTTTELGLHYPDALQMSTEAETIARKERGDLGRREEAVPSYSKQHSIREQRPDWPASGAPVRQPTSPAGAVSPSRKRRSSISFSATSPRASFRGALATSSGTSSRDGIAC